MDSDGFVDAVAALLMTWGVPQTPGRLYGHLLLAGRPTSLEEIAASLEISKTTASDAARLMERYGFLRRYGEPGTKRLSYGPSDDFTAFYQKQAAYLDRMARVMSAQSRTPLPAPAATRLQLMADFYGRLGDSMRNICDDYQ